MLLTQVFITVIGENCSYIFPTVCKKITLEGRSKLREDISRYMCNGWPIHIIIVNSSNAMALSM